MAAEITVPVHFHIQPSDALVYALMERARIFVFPPIEDFGMVAVEAMAAGTPVMANRVGGSGESVQDGARRSAVRSAVPRRDAGGGGGVRSARRGADRRHAQQFDATQFDAALRTWASPHIAFAKSDGSRPTAS